jgi:DNA processing protein
MPLPLSGEMRALLTLHLVPGLGPRLTAALVERFGSAEAVVRATPAQLRQVPHIGEKLAHDFHQAIARADVEGELALIDKHGVRLLALGTPEYPAALATLPDPPHLLYIRGSSEARDANAVAVVGSRSCTSYGRRITERLTSGLARAGFTIVSGLARGIDGIAHRAALQAGGRTVAVLAGGLSRIYPPEHVELAREVEASGALLSESPMGLEPLAGMFPARNRLISGLCRGVVIVEAAERSGALITARHAAEQGRDVFAVPGPVDSPASAGTLRLISQGAKLVRDADDIVKELGGTTPAKAAPAEQPTPPGLDATQQQVWDFLQGAPRHADEITRHLGLAVGDVSRLLITLELRKVIRRLPGNQYERR